MFYQVLSVHTLYNGKDVHENFTGDVFGQRRCQQILEFTHIWNRRWKNEKTLNFVALLIVYRCKWPHPLSILQWIIKPYAFEHRMIRHFPQFCLGSDRHYLSSCLVFNRVISWPSKTWKVVHVCICMYWTDRVILNTVQAEWMCKIGNRPSLI